MSANVFYPAFRHSAPKAGASLGTGLSGGGGGGTIDPMEIRVARLEEDMREIKSDLKALRADLLNEFKGLRGELKGIGTELTAVKVDVGRIDGRVAQLPTIWQTNFQMIGLTFSVIGGTFLIFKYGMQ